MRRKEDKEEEWRRMTRSKERIVGGSMAGS